MSTYTLYPTYVLRNADQAAIPLSDANIDYVRYLEWVDQGNTPDLPPPPTLQEVIAQFSAPLQAYMDGIAQQNGYDSVVSCASYKTSSVSQWAQDATNMIAWRDAMWTWAYGQQSTLAAMTPAEIAAITPDYIISQAPKPADYGWVVHAPGAPST